MVPKSKALSILLLMISICLGAAESASAAAVTLDPATTYQKMIGLEATTYACTWGDDKADYPKYIDQLLDRAVNEMGLSRVRLEIWSGAENPTDYGARVLAGQMDEGTFFDNYAYNIVNDNNDPNGINANGFKWSLFDHQIEAMVVPLRAIMAAKGESLFVNVCYVDFEPSSTFKHYKYPDEYAEFVLATYQHMDSKYGFVPDSWEVILEPDNSAWTGTQIGQCVAAAAARLIAAGYKPNFVAPSNVSMTNVLPFYNAAVAVSGAKQYISEISYHRYNGVTDSNLTAIADRAVADGKKACMLEYMGATYQELHKDLTLGRNSAWSGGFSIAGPNPAYDLFWVDRSNPSNPTFYPTTHAKFWRQYFQFVRNGAVRIKAASDDGNFAPLAFVNKNGAYVVVVKAGISGSLSIQGLPAGTYGVSHTTGSQANFNTEPDIALSDGQSLAAAIPGAGVLTVYQKSAGGVPPAAPKFLRIVP